MSGYVISPDAEGDIDEILEFVELRDGVPRAEHVADAFIHAFEQLAEMPRMGVCKPKLASAHVRWWTVFSYLVIYDAEASPIVILR